MKFKITLIVECGDSIIDETDKFAVKWLENELCATHNLVLHSNEIGDEIGTVIESSKPEIIK